MAGSLELSITSPSPAQLGEAPLDQAPASIPEPEVPAEATTETGAPAREFAILVLPALPQGHLTRDLLIAAYHLAALDRGLGDCQPRAVVGGDKVNGLGLVQVRDPLSQGLGCDPSSRIQPPSAADP